MIKKLQRIRAEKGFTLAELLVVILIIAILATLAIVFFSGQTDNAKTSVSESNLRSAYSAAQVWYTENNGSYGTAAQVGAAIEEGTNLKAAPPSTAGAGVVDVTVNSASSLTLELDGVTSNNGVIAP